MKLPLVQFLSQRVAAECDGLENGSAPMLEKVTPVTADLLRWWFQQDCRDTRAVNFHDGQRQAILHTIYAHEVLNAPGLRGLYQTLAPESLMLLPNYEAARNCEHPKYCLKMATGTGKTWVLQALLYWQLLNAARAPEDARFTKNFLVVAPGLIVYGRLLDAFLGKERNGRRDFATSDLARFQALFVPDSYRDEVFHFVQGNVATKEELGVKVTAGGLIGICNWHALADADEPPPPDAADIEAPGLASDPRDVAAAALPLSPGVSAGNSLETLNRRYERGGTLAWLAGLPGLMVFNDEAHHIHEVKTEGEITEVEWQKSLRKIAASKGGRFMQVDFSATPYNQVGAGKKAHAVFFPHIIADFDLMAAMRQGLVKSLALDKRRELGAVPNEALRFKADRDEHGNPVLSEGQRIMVSAGLAKLRKLEADFAALDAGKHPKMLVMCEDTKVTPLVEDFLKTQGLGEDEILRVDSNRKGELPEAEWAALREKLFDMDAHEKPRVVVSVLMLREGFDVNNICVIVPLRTTGAKILLEQTVGRGLRLMWRGNEFDEPKRENRERIRQGLEPDSLIDVLSIVEHPNFSEFYEQLKRDGYEFAETHDDSPAARSSTGDLVTAGLREGFEAFDFAVPFILREQEEAFATVEPDVTALPAFDGMTFAQLKAAIGTGDVFHSEDVQTKTRFGDYRVDGGVMTATGYNDFLARMSRRVADALGAPVTGSSRDFANASRFPFLQVELPRLAAWIDGYIRRRLFVSAPEFDPLADENWRLLCLEPVAAHIIQTFGRRLPELTETETTAPAHIAHRRLSEVTALRVRASSSIESPKCIYERLPFPSLNGGFERVFMEKAIADATVAAFCKVNEQRHLFMRLRYVKESGLPGFYSPDFLVRTAADCWLVETKAQNQLGQPDVVRKKTAAVAWCARLNELPPEERGGLAWHYCLLGEAVFCDFVQKGAAMEEVLHFSRIRPAAEATGMLF
ncbi:MAG: DEAD/DEAH box helicase family protein [Opitutaceae bacterium]|jgi:type III restriction enzyme|nr:DEAD/DEAH box helicase family protein [Opitutaceae bacterium]